MNCANSWGPSDHSGRLQRPKPEGGGKHWVPPPIQSRVKEQKFSDDFASKSNVDIREANIELWIAEKGKLSQMTN